MAKHSYSLVVIMVLLIILSGCGPMNTAINVGVSRQVYQPRLDQIKYAEYRESSLIFDSIDIDAPNVKNLYYMSADGSVGYQLYYVTDGIQQPVVSFFWYALQKSFSTVGINVIEGGIIKNVPQLHMRIRYLTDQDMRFILSLSRNGLLLVQKEIVAGNKFAPTNTEAELKQRAYEFIDSIAESILSDPDFRRAYFVYGTKRIFNNGELYYTQSVSSDEASRLGKYLMGSGYFDGNPKTVQINKVENAYEFRMVVKKGVENDPAMIEILQSFSRELSRNVFNGNKVDIHLCDGDLNAIKKLITM